MFVSGKMHKNPNPFFQKSLPSPIEHSQGGSELGCECEGQAFGSGRDQLFFFSMITVHWKVNEVTRFDSYGRLLFFERSESRA